MTTNIERYDQKRNQNRRGFLVWSTVFFVAWFIRSALKLIEFESDPLYTLLLIVLLVSIGLQVVFVFKDRRLDQELKKAPHLMDALNDELVQLNGLKAWKVAFFALIGFIVFAAILSMLMVINDLMLIFLTALLVGFGTRNMAVHFLNR